MNIGRRSILRLLGGAAVLPVLPKIGAAKVKPLISESSYLLDVSEYIVNGGIRIISAGVGYSHSPTVTLK